MPPVQLLYHANWATLSIQVGTHASGYVHTLSTCGISLLCSRNATYILTKALTENTQNHQIQEELIWNPSGRTIKVQPSAPWLLLHRPSLSELTIARDSVSLLSTGCPNASSHCSHLNSSHGFPNISKHFHFAALLSPGCAKQNPTFYLNKSLFNLHVYIIDAILLLVKRVGGLAVNFNYLFSSLLEKPSLLLFAL